MSGAERLTATEAATRLSVGTLTAERLVRDSKNPSGPVLIFPPAAWDAFVREVRAGTCGPH